MGVTLHDVARVAAVSIKTVSMVVNESPRVSSQTRLRVLEAIESTGYRPNMAARSLRSGRKGVLCLAVPELTLTFFGELSGAVIKAADRAGMAVFVEQTAGDARRELELLSSPRLQLTDGLILCPLGLTTHQGHEVQANVPIVILADEHLAAPVDHVTMQSVAGARAATEHLLKLGRRNIAVIGAAPELGPARLREEGYRLALEAAGVAYQSELVIPAQHWHRQNGADATQKLLDRQLHFDGLLGLNDSLAHGAMHQLRLAGLRIPEDVAVIGFDNLDESRFSYPTLTSVDPGVDALAATAVRLLLQRIGGGPDVPSLPRHVEIESRLMKRDSTNVLVSR